MMIASQYFVCLFFALALLASAVQCSSQFPDLSTEVGKIVSRTEGPHPGQSIFNELLDTLGGERLDQILRLHAARLPTFVDSCFGVDEKGVEMNVFREGSEYVHIELFFNDRQVRRKELIVSRRFHFPSPMTRGTGLAPVDEGAVLSLYLQIRLRSITVKLKTPALLSLVLAAIFYFHLKEQEKAIYFFCVTSIAALLAVVIMSYLSISF